MQKINYTLAQDADPKSKIPEYVDSLNGRAVHLSQGVMSDCFEFGGAKGEYFGPLKNGVPDGRDGIFTNPRIRIEGDWKNGKPDGEAKFYYDGELRYHGQCRAGKANGQGTWKRKKTVDGGFSTDSLKGSWNMGYAQGSCELTHAFHKVIGTFQHSRAHGFVKEFVIDQERERLRYTGETQNGRYHGQGTLYDYKERETYSGPFINNSPVYPDKVIQNHDQREMRWNIAKYAGVSLAAIFLLSECSESDAAEFDQVAKPEQQLIETVAPKPQNTDNQGVLSAF